MEEGVEKLLGSEEYQDRFGGWLTVRENIRRNNAAAARDQGEREVLNVTIEALSHRLIGDFSQSEKIPLGSGEISKKDLVLGMIQSGWVEIRSQTRNGRNKSVFDFCVPLEVGSEKVLLRLEVFQRNDLRPGLLREPTNVTQEEINMVTGRVVSELDLRVPARRITSQVGVELENEGRVQKTSFIFGADRKTGKGGIRVEAVTSMGGREYKKENEDYILAVSMKDKMVVVVLDGAGGHENGAEASRRAAEAVLNWLEGNYQPHMDLPETAHFCLLAAAQELDRWRLTSRINGHAVGTVAVIDKKGNFAVLGVGDCNAFWVSDKNLLKMIIKGSVKQLTQEHTLAAAGRAIGEAEMPRNVVFRSLTEADVNRTWREGGCVLGHLNPGERLCIMTDGVHAEKLSLPNVGKGGRFSRIRAVRFVGWLEKLRDITKNRKPGGDDASYVLLTCCE